MPVAMLSSSLITEPKRYGRFNALDTPQPTTPGMVLIKPSSISYTGASASVGTNGQITFSAATAININGVFSNDYENYAMSLACYVPTGVQQNGEIRLRSSGSDASGSDYSWQKLDFYSTNVEGARTSSATTWRFSNISTNVANGTHTYFYSPYKTKPTAFRSVVQFAATQARIYDLAGTHSLSSSYDGLSIIIPAEGITGALQIYGIRS